VGYEIIKIVGGIMPACSMRLVEHHSNSISGYITIACVGITVYCGAGYIKVGTGAGWVLEHKRLLWYAGSPTCRIFYGNFHSQVIGGGIRNGKHQLIMYISAANKSNTCICISEIFFIYRLASVAPNAGWANTKAIETIPAVIDTVYPVARVLFLAG
jgi:hypothetical protein